MATRNELELRVMFCDLSKALPQIKPGSAERRNAWNLSENIATAIRERNAFKP